MPTIPIYPGSQRTVHAWGDDQSCQVVRFLLKLAEDLNRDQQKLWKLIEQAGDDQPSHNREKCHRLEGVPCKDLWEFKAAGGSRIVWFFAKNGDIILTHACRKPKNNKAVVREQCEPAQTIKQAYSEE